jgi:hypothetical protein
MPFPVLPPTSRDFKPGDYPVKTYSAQSGAEVRILYGDTRTRMELSLGYDNATDAQAKQFLDHYDEVKGSFSTFEVDPSARAGWGSTAEAIYAAGVNRWRQTAGGTEAVVANDWTLARLPGELTPS